MSSIPDKPEVVAYERRSSPDAERHGPYQLVRHDQGVTITWRALGSALPKSDSSAMWLLSTLRGALGLSQCAP
jgi:hypothetical protein